MPVPFGPIELKKKSRRIKLKKSTKPGFRVPTPPPTKKFKSIKDYKRKKLKVKDVIDYE